MVSCQCTTYEGVSSKEDALVLDGYQAAPSPHRRYARCDGQPRAATCQAFGGKATSAARKFAVAPPKQLATQNRAGHVRTTSTRLQQIMVSARITAHVASHHRLTFVPCCGRLYHPMHTPNRAGFSPAMMAEARGGSSQRGVLPFGLQRATSAYLTCCILTQTDCLCHEIGRRHAIFQHCSGSVEWLHATRMLARLQF